MTCSFEGCTRPIHCKSLCTKHYKRLLRNGDTRIRKHPLTKSGTLDETASEILSNCKQEGDCMIFTGCSSNGYGVIKWNGKQRFVHVLVCESHHGDPQGRRPTRSCGHKLCCNPKHMRWTSWSEICKDMWKGKHPTRSKRLPDDTVLEIRRRLASGESGVSISRSTGIHHGIISGIKIGRAYKGVQ